MEYFIPHIISLFVGYLLGSIPFGVILTRLFNIGDIRHIGSGNIGATNVLRTGNRLVALLTLLGDALKGTLAVLLITYFFGVPLSLLAGFGAFLGHLFPVFLRFRGGKGVATYLGLTLGYGITGFVVFGIVWLLVAVIFRYSSLAALTASIIVPFYFLFFGRLDVSILFFLLSLILWLSHYSNILRLVRGEESRIVLSSGGDKDNKND